MSQKKYTFKFTYEVDVGEIELALYRLFQTLLHPLLYLLVFALHRKTSQGTRQGKNTAYTAKKPDFTPQDIDFVEVENEVGESDFLHSSTMRKCANPLCSNIFEKRKLGNQEKKFCSTNCKDVVNNKKKMNQYYQNV